MENKRFLSIHKIQIVCQLYLFSDFHFQIENEKWKSPNDFLFPFSNQKGKSELWNSTRTNMYIFGISLTDIRERQSCHTVVGAMFSECIVLLQMYYT